MAATPEPDPIGQAVFISYSSQDRATADAVRDHLQANDVACWMAPHDITPGSDWAAAIVEAIDRSQVFLLVLSRASNESDDVKREVGRASHRGIPIVPFFIEQVTLSKHLEYFLATTHWLGADARHTELRMAHLLTTVQQLIGDKKEPAPAPPEPPATNDLQDSGGLVDAESTVLQALRGLLGIPPDDASTRPAARPTAAALVALGIGGLGVLLSLRGLLSAVAPSALTGEAQLYAAFPLVRLAGVVGTTAGLVGNLVMVIGGRRMWANRTDGPGVTIAGTRWSAIVVAAWTVVTLVLALSTGPEMMRSDLVGGILATALLAAPQLGAVWLLAVRARDS